MSELRIPARETVYAGHLFRSSLEATWAAFFDRLGWPWVYEPYEFASYIPDFALKLKHPVLVEVKPCLSLDELREHVPKIEAACSELWEHDILLVGADWNLGETSEQLCGTSIGLLGEYHPGEDGVFAEPHSAGWHFGGGVWASGKHWGFGHDEWSYGCRTCGREDDHCCGSLAPAEGASLAALWGDAKRATRWTPGEKKPALRECAHRSKNRYRLPYSNGRFGVVERCIDCGYREKSTFVSFADVGGIAAAASLPLDPFDGRRYERKP